MNHSFYYMKSLRRGKLYRFFLALSAAASLFFLTGVLNVLSCSRAAQESLSENVAPQVLRFHVLANSDSPEDQALKMEVRGLLLDSIYSDVCCGSPRQETCVPSTDCRSSEPLSKKELQTYISDHHEELERKAEAYMSSRGFPYSASIRLERCYFPTKQYGDVSFPCGTYDAVRVLLGEGKGKNWWCVLYPALCFSGVSSTGEMPDESKQQLKNLLPDDDYRPLMVKRRIVFGEGRPSASLPAGAQTAPAAAPQSGRASEPETREVTVHVRLKFWDALR